MGKRAQLWLVGVAQQRERQRASGWVGGLDLGSFEGEDKGRWKIGRRWKRDVDSGGGLYLGSCAGLNGDTMGVEERWMSIRVRVAFRELSRIEGGRRWVRWGTTFGLL